MQVDPEVLKMKQEVAHVLRSVFSPKEVDLDLRSDDELLAAAKQLDTALGFVRGARFRKRLANLDLKSATLPPSPEVPIAARNSDFSLTG